MEQSPAAIKSIAEMHKEVWVFVKWSRENQNSSRCNWNRVGGISRMYKVGESGSPQYWNHRGVSLHGPLWVPQGNNFTELNHEDKKWGFCQCTYLEKIVIPKLVHLIERSAFIGCTSGKMLFSPATSNMSNGFVCGSSQKWCHFRELSPRLSGTHDNDELLFNHP